MSRKIYINLMKFISVKPCLIQNLRKSRYSVFLFYFQELPVEVFHPPHVIDTCTLYIYEVHRSLRKENAFSFSFRKQIFLQIFPSVFCFVPSSHIFGMQLNWGFHKSSFTLCSQEWKGIMHLTDRDDNGCFMHILKYKLNAFFPLVPIF